MTKQEKLEVQTKAIEELKQFLSNNPGVTVIADYTGGHYNYSCLVLWSNCGEVISLTSLCVKAGMGRLSKSGRLLISSPGQSPAAYISSLLMPLTGNENVTALRMLFL